MLAVTDTGQGIDPEALPHIFEPFFTTKEQGSGTGLGLSTVYGVVKQSGGHIWVYSEVGTGTTFKIYLPALDGPVDSLPLPLGSYERMPRGTETVLLVEDEPAVRELSARVLRELGYTVLEAEDGEVGLKLAQEFKGGVIDIIVTDIVMPRMGGKALADQIRTYRPDIKVLFASGYPDRALVSDEVINHTASFLQKPFTPSSLARKVREVLDDEQETS
jgi:CheY-like chemotaxis protein